MAANLAIAFMGSTLVTPLYVLYQRRFVFSELTLTLIYAAYVVGNLAALFFLGRLSDQVGRRRVSLAAIAIACASTAIFLFASGTAWLFAGRMVSGLAIGLASGTNTAWIAELTEGRDKAGASVAASTANMLGLAVGPLVGGVLAQYAPAPLRLSFCVYLVLLVVMALAIRRARETVERPARIRHVSLRPRLGVPREIRVSFVAPGMTAFATFAMASFYAALVPSLLVQDLHTSDLTIGGDVVFELFLTAALAIILTRHLKSRTAMLSGLGLMMPSLALLIAAQELRSLPLLLVGAAVSGLAVAMGYRGSLQVVNLIAPAERRAEVISSYLVACYLGNSLPVIGIGVISRFTASDTANFVFAVIVALCALA
ncbi:MAG TPA: MFS transporter, partial [Desulfuromonadaceae bacterium]